MHHWTDKDAGLREVSRVLTTGGVFVLADLALRDALGRLTGEGPFMRAEERERALPAAGLRILGHERLRFRGVLITTAERS